MATTNNKVENGSQNGTSSDSVNLYSLEGENQGIVVIGMNRPAVRNALNFEVLERFSSILSTLHSDKKARALIIKSDVKGVFCAGADLKERVKMSIDDYKKWSQQFRHVTNELSNIHIPTIVAIEGPALGGGMEMSLACDLRVAATKALLGLPETSIGIIPGAGGTQRLPRLVGPSVANDIILTGRRIDGTEAFRTGLVNYLVPNNETNDAAYLKALEVSKKIMEKAPLAIKMAKRAINDGLKVDIDEGLEIERTCYAQCLVSKDRNEGMKAFLEKRKPNFKGE